LEYFKVFPGVVMPSDVLVTTRQEDIHCRLYQGPAELTRLRDRTWKQKFEMSSEEVGRLASLLGLKEIPVRRLLARAGAPLPPEAWDYQKHCRDLIDYVKKREPSIDRYVPNSVKEESFQQTSEASEHVASTVEDLFRSLSGGTNFLIKAPSGLGKTTCCLYFCFEMANKRLRDCEALFPLYVQLSDYRKAEDGLFGLFRGALSHLGFDSEELKRSLAAGGYLLCLDGLNESPREEQTELYRELKPYGTHCHRISRRSAFGARPTTFQA